MKIVFLDIDGVINTKNKRQELELINLNLGMDWRYNNIFCKKSLMNLLDIVRYADAKIVIISARRFSQLIIDAVEAQFMEYGLLDYLIDNTPIVDENLKHGVGKELEINAWLQDKDIESFVILDDFIPVFNELLPNVIEINPHDGITLEVMLLAINKLNGETK